MIRGGSVRPPVDSDKDAIRRLHAAAVDHRRAQAERALRPFEERLLAQIAEGWEVEPELFEPRLEAVLPRTDGERLFRYAALHWSVPVSSGYGRRLRFLVRDGHNGRLVGLIGLCDPVISMRARDDWIGWLPKRRVAALRHLMDAYVLGAVPPYSQLLCGKLIALLAASDPVRHAFRRKYAGSVARISGRRFDGRLAMVTTMSALGRSSVYNRLTFRGAPVFFSVGVSAGTGEFQFANGLYSLMATYAARHCQPTYRRAEWGTGFRNRREVVRKCLREAGLTAAWGHHGVSREIFAIPLARNTCEFLQGKHSRLNWFGYHVDDLTEWFKARWMLARATRDSSFRSFRRADYRLWP